MGKEEKKSQVSSPSSIAALYAGAIGVTAFWLLVLFKKVFDGLADLLNWRGSIGPLSGTFGVSLIVIILSYLILDKYLSGVEETKLANHEKTAIKVFVVASILVFFMTFPPIFEPIAELFHS